MLVRLIAAATLLSLVLPSISLARDSGRHHHGSAAVTCESLRGGYRECHTGFRNPPDLVRQLSDAACVENRSWGFRPGMVWVSQGCRAVFEEGRGSPGWGGGRPEQEFVCESRRGRYAECTANFRGQIDIIEQLSRDPCVEGRTWGQTRDGVWVDGGCRARFGRVRGWGGGHWGQGSGYTQQCESRDRREQRCAWDPRQGTPFVLEQLSHTACVRNQTWGFDSRRGELWVNGGCRAVFGAR